MHDFRKDDYGDKRLNGSPRWNVLFLCTNQQHRGEITALKASSMCLFLMTWTKISMFMIRCGDFHRRNYSASRLASWMSSTKALLKSRDSNGMVNTTKMVEGTESEWSSIFIRPICWEFWHTRNALHFYRFLCLRINVSWTLRVMVSTEAFEAARLTRGKQY